MFRPVRELDFGEDKLRRDGPQRPEVILSAGRLPFE